MIVDPRIKIEAFADTVLLRLFDAKNNAMIELHVAEAEKLLVQLSDAVSVAKSFAPGVKPFSEWVV